jgi:hypothetical protein
MAVFVRFMRDNCGHCTQSQGEWDKLTKMKIPVKLFEVRNNAKFVYNGKRHARSAVPTYVLFDGAREIEYNGQRTAAAMQSFLNKQKHRGGSRRKKTRRQGRVRARTRAARSSS